MLSPLSKDCHSIAAARVAIGFSMLEFTAWELLWRTPGLVRYVSADLVEALPLYEALHSLLGLLIISLFCYSMLYS